MNKIIFFSTFMGVILTALVCSAATSPVIIDDPVEIDLGIIDRNVSWSPEQDDVNGLADRYRLSFTVNNSNGVDFTITMNKSVDVWFFNGKEKTWYASDTESELWSWQKHFAEGTYTMDIYGRASEYRISGDIDTVVTPIPGALLLLASGMLGLFSIRRTNEYS